MNIAPAIITVRLRPIWSANSPAADLVRQFVGGQRAQQSAQRDPARHHFDEQRAERKRRLDAVQSTRDPPWS